MTRALTRDIPLASVQDPAFLDRYWKKVKKRGADECWEWQAGTVGNGYGMVGVGGGVRLAHRISFLLANGHLPATKCVLHRCDNPRCVNPSHLLLGTHSENTEDRVNKDRSGSRAGALPEEMLANAKFWDRLRSKVDVRMLDDCWPWTGAVTGNGYGQIRWKGKNYPTHRIIYNRHNAHLDPSKPVRHTCGNRACMNPAHLYQPTGDLQ